MFTVRRRFASINRAANYVSYHVKPLSKCQTNKHIPLNKEYKGETINILPSTSRITLAIIPTVGYAYKGSNGIAYRVPRHVEGLDDGTARSPTASASTAVKHTHFK